MLGAIIGDMVGSAYESNPCKRKDFNIFDPRMRMTDDSYLTLAVAKVLSKHYPISYEKGNLALIQKELIEEFVNTWKKHKNAGFGAMFYNWCEEAISSSDMPKPYNSYGNGSAMRISPVGWIARSEEEVKLLSKTVTEITHNHIEGLKGAEAIAMCVYLALHGSTKEEIKERMIKDYYPLIAELDYDELVKNYVFSEICQKSVPQAICCFLISSSLEDTIRNCVGIGGDCDTTGAMAGAIAEAYYQKDKMSEFESKFLYLMMDKDEEESIRDFYLSIGSKKMNK